VLESIIATRISYLAETFDLLPAGHLGDRKLNSSEQAIHMLVERTHSELRDGLAASLLLLDVSGAFDNVSWQWLIHNM
jgi:hypothetical protein